MFDIKSMAAAETCDVVVIDPLTDGPLINDDGEVCSVTVSGPATGVFAEAENASRWTLARRVRRREEEPEEPEEERSRVGQLLAKITVSFNGFTYRAQSRGYDAFLACYTDKRFKFLTEMLLAEAGRWGNYAPSRQLIMERQAATNIRRAGASGTP